MTVVVVNDYCFVSGGAAQVAIDSALALAEGGYKVIFFAALGPPDPRLTANALVDVQWSGAVSFLDNPSRTRAALEGWYNKFEAKRLYLLTKTLDRTQTIVHVHGWMKALSPSIFRALKRANFKTVVTLHDYFIACPNGGFIVYPESEICNRTALSISCLVCNCDSRSYSQKLWRFGRGLIQKHVAVIHKTVSGYIAVSEFSLDRLKKYLPESSLLRVIRNPIAAPIWKRSLGSEGGPILYVGRLSAEKGAAIAAEAARKIGRPLIVVGSGPLDNALRTAYPEVVFTGWLNRAGVLEMMRAASILAFPSIWWETNGLTVIEGFSQGLPAVVSRGTAASQFVADGTCGRLFDMGDADDMAAQMRFILAEWNKFSGAAHSWYWSDPWTAEEHCSELLSFYSTVLHMDAHHI